MIWAVLTAVTLLAALWLVLPFLRTTTMETGGGDAAVSIYADQADEVHRDQSRGLISAGEAKAALSEIDHRRKAAVKHLSSGLAVANRAPVAAVTGGLVLLAISIGGYVWTGSPEANDLPLALRAKEQLEQQAAAGDITARIQLLIERTEEDPESFEAWWILARSHAAVGDHAASAEAYRQAVLLKDDDPGVMSAYAEAMTLANGNKVPEGAEIIFSQVVRETNDPRAYYYLALARAQRQDFEGALDDWTALAMASDPGAPWMPLVRRDIVNMARFLDKDVASYLPDATEAELAAASGQLAPEGPDTGALRVQLAEDPMDHAAWMALARAEAEAGDEEAAAMALAEARGHFRAAPFVLEKFAELERSLGLDLVAGDEHRGPTGADIAAAAEMTEADRDEMIRGMVAGLAARLDEAPQDPDGWVMLIRSYRTLGQAGKAEEALARARTLYDGTETMQKILEAL